MRHVGVAALCLAQPGAALAEATSQVGQIRASYRVGVAAIDLGTFDLTASVRPNSYSLKARGEFSILAGLVYKGEGNTQSNGKRVNANPTPKRFNLSYADNRYTQTLEILFANEAAPTVTRIPKKRPDKKAVPLSDDQLRNVLDPLTAAFLSIHGNVPQGDLAVCDQTLRVFDGKRLFELVLSPKRTQELGPRAAGGLRAAAVCEVRYQPIGGHRPESSTVAFLQKTKGIEAWLVPVLGADLFVPYKVVVPTAWGDGTVKLTKLKTSPAGPRRASAR
ncbi:MAG: DUF3108 domain-containing protein [Alphaproteobacteria bacterium]